MAFANPPSILLNPWRFFSILSRFGLVFIGVDCFRKSTPPEKHLPLLRKMALLDQNASPLNGCFNWGWSKDVFGRFFRKSPFFRKSFWREWFGTLLRKGAFLSGIKNCLFKFINYNVLSPLLLTLAIFANLPGLSDSVLSQDFPSWNPA